MINSDRGGHWEWQRWLAESRMNHKSSLSSLVEAPAGAPPTVPTDIRFLVEAHFAFIARSVRRLGVPDTDVEDAAQQVFLIAAQKLDRVVPGNEKAFLFGIATRVASEARRALRRRTVRESAVAKTADVVSVTPEELARERQARVVLDEILDAMPEDLRPVFTLFELEELTMAEIAILLGIPSGSVASRLRRAREIFHSEAAKRR
jgi:RNA polymerase sigma-70 factor (ECF subfamily)